jgi:hypothetical protein
LAPLTWHFSGGQLPPGLNVSQAGKIEGTPTAAASQPFTFEMTVSDSSQPPQLAAQRFSIAIAAPPLRIVGSASATGSAPLKIVSANSSGSPQDNPGTAAAAANAASLSTSHPSGESSPRPQGVSPSEPKQDPPKPVCGPDSDTRGHCGGQFLRTIVGFEQSGVSAAASKQDFFFDLLYDRPLGFQIDTDLGPALRSWGNLRISSVPQQINSGVAQFAADFAQKVGEVKVNQVAQSFEFLGGIQYRLFAPGTDPKDEKDEKYFGGPDATIRHRVSINAILGGGLITPLSPQDSVQIFKVPSNQPNFLKA